jgi:hypothetical protein
MKVESIAEVVKYALERFDAFARAHRGDDTFPVRLPPGDGFQSLLQEAFWTSIARDEARPCRFTVAYYAATLPALTSELAVALDPRPFARDRLRRLASVAFAADAKIAVASVDGHLCIVGLSKHLRASPPSTTVPLPIEVEVLGPGHIALRYALFRIMTYRGGQIPGPAPNIVHVAGPVRNALDRLAQAAGFPAGDLPFKLKSLFAHIERHAHGGLLVIASEEPHGLESVSWRITNDVYSLVDVHRLWWDNLGRLELPEEHPDRLDFGEVTDRQRDLSALEAQLLGLSASLALADGAVWLDGSLRPRAFGVFAQLDPTRTVHLAADVAGTLLQQMHFDDLGARHRAMVALASQNPGCPAVAMSADGGFSAALRVDGRDDVLVWRFEGGDLEVDDPFDAQYRAIWKELLARTTTRETQQRLLPPAP